MPDEESLSYQWQSTAWWTGPHASLLQPGRVVDALSIPALPAACLVPHAYFSSQSSNDYDYLTHGFGAVMPTDGSFMRSRTIVQLELAN